MTTTTKNPGDFFYRTLAVVAISAPMLMTLAASQLSEGAARGEFMVHGLGAVLIVLGTVLALRSAYTLGSRKVLGLANSEPNRPVTA